MFLQLLDPVYALDQVKNSKFMKSCLDSFYSNLQYLALKTYFSVTLGIAHCVFAKYFRLRRTCRECNYDPRNSLFVVIWTLNFSFVRYYTTIL